MLNLDWRTPRIIATIDGFFSKIECAEAIAYGETHGFEDATVTTANGALRLPDVRNNDRVMIDDSDRAASLYQRLATVLPTAFDGTKPICLNERLRLYRYDVGQKFDWHRDGYFQRDDLRSRFTFMVYLNDDFEGGGTSFDSRSFGTDAFERFTVKPKAGMALLFHHPIMHRGDSVKQGRKYVLRSDVMYQRIDADRG